MPSSLTYIGEMDEITQEQFDAALIIVLDCANTPRIDCPFEVDPSKVIKIDHHPDRDVYGAISFVDTNSSSTSEILCRFAFDVESTWKVSIWMVVNFNYFRWINFKWAVNTWSIGTV